MNKHPIIVGNWKMNTNLSDALVLTEVIKDRLEEIRHIDTVICPPFVWLYPIKEILDQGKISHLALGAQNCFSQNDGPFTGEVSPSMLDAMVSYVIIGHSERILHFEEKESLIRDKIKAVLSVGLTPIVCVGEIYKEPNSIDIVQTKVENLISGIKESELEKLIFAYEPVWAIGTGIAASGEYADQVCSQIRRRLTRHNKILYGGSVSSENANEFLGQDNIDGLLIGGASLKAREFIKICQIASEIRK